MLGKTVTVVVTNPIGSVSDGKTFPLNFGYIRDSHGKSSSVQQAYIYGMDHQVYSFNGTIVAQFTRNDGNIIYMVAPSRHSFFEPELMMALKDAEPNLIKKEFHYEKSCGAVLFTEKNGIRHYLLVRNRSGFYGFPKGHIEGVENEHETANREILEETGLNNVTYIRGFCEVNKYMCRAYTKKRVVLFLARFNEDEEIHPTMEIDDCQLLPYEQAYRTIGHQNDKDILEHAERFLASKKGP